MFFELCGKIINSDHIRNIYNSSFLTSFVDCIHSHPYYIVIDCDSYVYDEKFDSEEEMLKRWMEIKLKIGVIPI